MATKGLRQAQGGAAVPPYSKGPYVWSNLSEPSPFQTTPWLDFDIKSNNLTVGARQGAVRIKFTRDANHALTAWDGNPDTALKITALNSADNSTNGDIRSLDVQARTNADCAQVYAEEHNARCSSGATVANLKVAHFRAEIYGTVSTSIYGLDVEISNEGAAATTSAGIWIRNTDASTANAIGSAIRVSNSGGTNTGFDYLIDASGSDALATAAFKFYDDGSVCNDTNATGSQTTAGYLTVVVGTATRYIWLANAAPTA